MGCLVVFVFPFRGKGGIRKGADGDNVVFQEIAVAERLVDFRRRASGDGISIGSFCTGVRHGGINRLSFFLFLSRPRDAPSARYIFWTGVFVLTWDGITSGAVGAWVADFRIRGMGGGGHYCWCISGGVA